MNPTPDPANASAPSTVTEGKLKPSERIALATDAELDLLLALQRQFSTGYIVDVPTLQLIREYASKETAQLRDTVRRMEGALKHYAHADFLTTEQQQKAEDALKS